eukprot:8541938-Pyramimonas_sp.AAC.1
MALRWAPERGAQRSAIIRPNRAGNQYDAPPRLFRCRWPAGASRRPPERARERPEIAQRWPQEHSGTPKRAQRNMFLRHSGAP